MQTLLAQLRASGVADADIQTSNLELEPEYDHRDGTAVLRGYRVSNQVSVTLRDLDSGSQEEVPVATLPERLARYR